MAICNLDDLIDSREIIERINELESSNPNDLDQDDRDELTSLKSLEEEASGSGDWIYGAILVRDSYFEDYARQLAEDIGAVNNNMGWPLDCIDWEAAADALKVDYASVDFDGVTYWVR